MWSIKQILKNYVSKCLGIYNDAHYIILGGKAGCQVFSSYWPIFSGFFYNEHLEMFVMWKLKAVTMKKKTIRKKWYGAIPKSKGSGWPCGWGWGWGCWWQWMDPGFDRTGEKVFVAGSQREGRPARETTEAEAQRQNLRVEQNLSARHRPVLRMMWDPDGERLATVSTQKLAAQGWSCLESHAPRHWGSWLGPGQPELWQEKLGTDSRTRLWELRHVRTKYQEKWYLCRH